MASPNNKDFSVGHGKPPQHTRFKKGESGNPRGRPKGKKNLVSILNHALSMPVVVTEGGKRVRKTKLEVALMQLVNKAVTGDLPSLIELRKLLPLLDAADVATSPDLAADRAMALNLVARLAARDNKENENES